MSMKLLTLARFVKGNMSALIAVIRRDRVGGIRLGTAKTSLLKDDSLARNSLLVFLFLAGHPITTPCYLVLQSP